jgi:hypothetical protein
LGVTEQQGGHVTVELDPQKRIFREESKGARWTHAAGAVSIGSFAITIVLVVMAIAKAPSWGLVVTGLAFLWAVGAPAWFWFEYFFLYRKDGLPGTFELYKYGQQVSVAIWAALALSLGALASSDHFKKHQNTKPSDASTSREAASQPAAPAASK